ncbi:MAG: 1-(5-phosphoribosyl)-5-[(5-phosphoribosylamino)methylideneamino]imidazole-4-carboxamide isomerase [Candidatus Margulisiibacteriota bacterium]
MFEIIPAIDIINGKCVRLTQGRYSAETVYSADPLEIAKKWEAAGAARLHIIDLDGARTGLPKNIALIKNIAHAVKIPLQVGGGIRNISVIKELLDAGVDRIILGTTAVNNPNTLAKFCEAFGEQLAVAVDVKNGKIATEGWAKLSNKDVFTLAKGAIELGVKRFVYTDVSRDGMLGGPNIEAIKTFLAAVNAAVIASGGISSAEDVAKIKETGVEGCIIGKALYEGKVKLEEIL